MPGTLFVRSGGGMPGLDIHAGIWLALEERGVVPTEVCGTSAGAVVSALQAAGRKADWSAAILTSLVDADVRREVRAWKLRIPWIDHWLDNAPIRELLARLLPAGFEELALPLSAWATLMETGEAVDVARPEISADPATAVLASMSICGVFPPVVLNDGLSYIDGGVRRNLPLPANWLDYDQVWLLIASGRPRDYRRGGGILTNLIRNVHYLMQDQVEDVIETVRAGSPGDVPWPQRRVHVVWPQLCAPNGMLHFDHTLFAEAYNATRDQLKEEPL